MKRSLFVLGVAAATAVGTFSAPVPAAADTGGSSYSASIYGSAGSIDVEAVGTGLVGGLLASLLAPLTNTLASVANTLSTTLVTAVTQAGLEANNPTRTQSPPSGDNYPADCTSSGWTADDCYSATGSAPLSVPGVASLNLNVAQGYAAADDNGYYAKARVTSPAIKLLGVDLGNLGVATSSVTCPTTVGSSCTAAAAVTDVSLLGGLVKLQTATGGDDVLQVSLANGAWVPVSSLTAPVPLAGNTVTVSADGDLLKVTTSLSLNTLLSALGLGGLLSSLTGLDPTGTHLDLSIVVGPGHSDANGGTAWGLGVGLDLSGDVQLAQFGVLTGLLGSASIHIPSGITGSPSALGNLATLQLAYTAATPGAAVLTGPVWYPPGLI